MLCAIRSICGRVLFSGEYESIKDALCQAVKANANLSGANLSGADLSEANLCEADLCEADLSRANLSRADLCGADLAEVKADLIWQVLKLPDEIENVIACLQNGTIDGSTYSGACSCLVGTMSAHCGVNIHCCSHLPGLNGLVIPKEPESPRERWFANIRPGHTPTNNPFAKLAVDWLREAITIRDAIRQSRGFTPDTLPVEVPSDAM
jgi:hypothetical protein